MVFNDSFSATRSFLIMLFNVRCCLLNFSPSSLSSLISESLSSIRTLNCAVFLFCYKLKKQYKYLKKNIYKNIKP